MSEKENDPDVCSLIDDAVTLYIEEFWGSVGDGAALSGPVLRNVKNAIECFMFSSAHKGSAEARRRRSDLDPHGFP